METNDSSEQSEALRIDRRGALRILALAGAGLFAAQSNSQAFFDFLAGFAPVSPSVLSRNKVPLQWMSLLGQQLPAYADFLDRLNIRHIPVRQIIEPHTKTKGSIHNSLPPRSMWPNIRSTLRVLDSLSDRLEETPDAVVSVYRNPAYNRHCPGARSNSYHLRNNAVDIVFPCAPGKVAAMARAMRSTGLFKGGVGRYSGFTHVDTRGNNADW